MAITIDTMKEHNTFVPVAVGEKLLSRTEPVETVKIDEGAQVSFKVADDWLVKAGQSDLSQVDVQVTVDGKEYALSKAAAFGVGQVFGIQNTYLPKITGSIYETLLNHHYGDRGSKAFAALAIGDVLHGLVRPGLSVYSNLQILEQTIAGIEAAYGKDTEVLVDRRTFNTLTKTDIRLVVPEVQRTIHDGGLHDVPSGETDTWSAGIHISNSVTGKSPTTLSAYLFRYWCANGATVRNEDVGTWHRAFDSTVDIYEWSKANTEEILAGMEKQFDAVQHLTGVDVDGRVGSVINETLRPMRVSASIRNDVAQGLLDYDDVSLYTVMNAITSYANRPGLDQDYINRFMTAGGNLASRSVTSEKATIWKEGHLAPPTAPNPYEVV